jgi:hypothetical protein
MTPSQLALPLPDGHSAVSLEACRRLAKIVARQRASYEVRRYRERRAAALKGLAR